MRVCVCVCTYVEGVEIFSIDFSFVIRKVGGREMRKGDKFSSLDRLIDFFFSLSFPLLISFRAINRSARYV